MFILIQIYIYWFQMSSAVDKLVLVGYSLFSICIVYSIFLYCSLGWVVKIMLDLLNKKVLSSWKPNNTDIEYWDRQLKLWKAEYYLISELVHHINDCFGPFILFVLTNFFVRIINNLFTTLHLIRMSTITKDWTGVLYVFWAYLAENLFLFIVIIYIPYIIRQKVITNLLNIFPVISATT